MLIEGQQHIGVVPRAQHFARANADLEDGWPPRNGRGNGHEGHDLLGAAASQPRQETANRLDTILRITRNANDGLRDLRDFGCLACLPASQYWIAHEIY